MAAGASSPPWPSSRYRRSCEEQQRCSASCSGRHGTVAESVRQGQGRRRATAGSQPGAGTTSAHQRRASTHHGRHLSLAPAARQRQLGRAAHVDEHLVPRLAGRLHNKAGLGSDQLDCTQVGGRRATAAAARAHAPQQLLHWVGGDQLDHAQVTVASKRREGLEGGANGREDSGAAHLQGGPVAALLQRRQQLGRTRQAQRLRHRCSRLVGSELTGGWAARLGPRVSVMNCVGSPGH